MKEEIVSFSTAKLANKKKFFWPTKERYNKKGEFNYSKAWSIAAPTQSLLQRWLREVHGIHLESCLTMGMEYSFRIYKGLDDKGFTDVDKYEEALEAGLQGALKLIP